MIEEHKTNMGDSSAEMFNEKCTINLSDKDNLLGARVNMQLYVEFNELTYSVPHGKGKTKKVLQSISGCFRPGRLTAIIGPSGAGKSSLLGIISTLKTVNVKGSITINGVERNGDVFRKQTCFIPQEFALLPLLTAKETLHIAARLKLDRGIKSSSPHLVVNETAENLGLMNCLDTMVENLSGGERKRLSIGIEIITKPLVLLLDEPTSGLDSSSSNQVINLLHTMSRSGCTVVCAVHQPSCKMISQFDDALVLDHGRCFYCGPWSEILDTFSIAGYECPQFYNIAEFVLEVVTGERGGELENLHQISLDKHLKRDKQYRYPQGENSPTLPIGYFQRQDAKTCANNQKTLSGWEQQKVLFSRALICIKRDNTMTKLRFAAHVVVAILLGLVFYDSGTDASRTSSNISCIFFVLLFLYFSSSMPAVQIFPTEAAVFVREYLNNWYNLKSYYIVKVLSDIPLQIICPTVFISITYIMTGQPWECHRFAQTWGICVLMTILGQSTGILTGVAFNTQIGVFLIPALNMPMILFAGFFLKFNEIAFYLQPMCTISFFRYSFQGILQAIYGGDRERLPCSQTFCYLRTPKDILEGMDMQSVSYQTNVLMLCVWIVCLQVLIYLILRWKANLAKK